MYSTVEYQYGTKTDRSKNQGKSLSVRQGPNNIQNIQNLQKVNSKTNKQRNNNKNNNKNQTKIKLPIVKWANTINRHFQKKKHKSFQQGSA